MDALVERLNAAGALFIGFGLPMLVQSSLVIAVLLGLDLVLRRRVRAVVRYGLLMLILVKLVLPVGLSVPTGIGYWIGGELALPQPVAVESPAPAVASVALVGVPLAACPPVRSEQDTGGQAASGTRLSGAPDAYALPSPRPEALLTWQAGVFAAWCIAVIALGLLLAQRVRFVSALVAQSSEAGPDLTAILEECRAALGLRRPVRLRLSPNAASPAVCGLWRPVILMPQDLPGCLGVGDLRAVLLHELVHVKRRDLWVNCVQTVLQIVYFYNPLLWLANWAIRRVREQAVDEAVLVAMGTRAGEYPETLLAVARLSLSRPVLSLRLIGVVESRSALSARIRHMVGRPLPKSARLGVLGLGAIALGAAVLLPMAARARAAATLPATKSGLSVAAPAGTAPAVTAPVPAPVAPAPSTAAPSGSLSDSLAETHRRLSRHISVNYNKADLETVLSDLGRQANVRIAVDWSALGGIAGAGVIHKDVKVSVSLADVPIYKALGETLAASGLWPDGDPDRVAMAIDKNGTVRVSWKSVILPVPMATVTYDVRDLIPKQDFSRFPNQPRERAALYAIWSDLHVVEPNKTVAIDKTQFVGTTLVIPTTPRIHSLVAAELAKMRGQKQEEPSDAILSQRLAMVVDAVDLYGTSLTKALEFFQKDCDLNISVDWDALKEFEIDDYTPLTVQRMQNGSLAKVLAAAVDNVQSRKGRLTWKAEKGVILISAEKR